jgi:hypothetical protein
MAQLDETGTAAVGGEEHACLPQLLGLGSKVSASLRTVASQLAADAAAVGEAERVPASHLELLAAHGFYGLFAPTEIGGLGLDYPEMCAVVEELASACLATTFVWVQHFRFLGALLDPATPVVLRDRYLKAAVTGLTKAGVALTGLLPGPPRLRARRAPDGWRLEGEAPWVSGWGTVDLITVLTRGPEGSLVSLLMEAKTAPGLTAEPIRLMALNATQTVRLHFDDVFLPDSCFISEQDYEQARRQSERLRLNGSFALGLIRRCSQLMGPSPLDQELSECRAELDAADELSLPSARAHACELAVRAASRLVVSRGSGSVVAGDVAERLSREATFLLVFGSRPGIKDSLLTRLGSRQ